MNKIAHLVTLGSFCLIGITAAHAQSYQSSVSTNGSYTTSSSSSGFTSATSNSGYTSSTSSDNAVTPYTTSTSHARHEKHRRFDVIFDVPVFTETTTYLTPSVRMRPRPPIYWVNRQLGDALPNGAVEGGYQRGPRATFFVCRTDFHGGLHPGKLLGGECHISWGGQEVIRSHYQVLVSRVPFQWIGASYGRIPAGAIRGGEENGEPLYICQANYRNGWHTGKIVGQNCNIGWGGQEITLPHYNVLVR